MLSKAFSINWLDLWKSLRTLLLVAAVIVAYGGIQYLLSGAVDFGSFSPFILPVLVALADLLRRYIKDNSQYLPD